MMWTIIAPEIWSGQTEKKIIEEQVICRNGIWMSVAKDDSDGYRIRRILSTNPDDFLCEGICPGAILRR